MHNHVEEKKPTSLPRICQYLCSSIIHGWTENNYCGLPHLFVNIALVVVTIYCMFCKAFIPSFVVSAFYGIVPMKRINMHTNLKKKNYPVVVPSLDFVIPDLLELS